MVRIYKPENLESIAAALALPVEDLSPLVDRLEGGALWYRLCKNSPARITPSRLTRRLKLVASQSERLLKSLGIEDIAAAADGPNDPVVLEALASTDGPSEEDILTAAERIARLSELLNSVLAASDLNRWAEVALDRSKRVGKQITPIGHVGDWGTNEWIASMMEIYEDLTGRKARTSVGGEGQHNAGEAAGPLIRFLMAAQAPIGLDLGSDALRSRIRTILKHARKDF